MDYQRAKDIRGKSLSSLITDNIVSGGGIGSSISQALSEKSKARMTGLKEKFDPLNIAKTLTGGSRLAPAILGRLMGRNPDTINYFAGDPKKKKNLSSEGLDTEAVNFATETLGSIYVLMQKMEREKMREEHDRQEKENQFEEEEDKRNQELIKALTARRVPKKKAKKEAKEVQDEEKKKKQQQKQETADRKKETEVKKKTAEKVEEAKKPEVVKKVEPKPTAKPEVKAPPTKPTAAKVIPGAAAIGAGIVGLVASELASAGLSEKAQANVLAQVQSESNFNPRSENLNYSTPEAIQNTFGKNRIPSLDFAKQFVKNPEALANHVYAKTDGNSEPGDGWKYRGRGFLQHTGKAQYEAIKKYTGIDVVSNPDLLNDPKVAAKAIPWFFLSYKRKKPEQLENISEVNKAVGFSDPTGQKAKKREELAFSFQNGATQLPPTLSTGDAINSKSTENKELKKQADKQISMLTVNNNSTTQTKSSSSSFPAQGDDRSAYAKKVQ